MLFSPRMAVASLVLTLAAVPSLAQTAPAPATGAPAAAPAAPATLPAPVPALPQPEVPPEKLAMARQVVLASGMGRSFEPMVPQLEEQIPAVITRTRPELSKDVGAVLTQLHPEFSKKTDEMIDIAARIYARRLSDEDLKATVAFFDSPAGTQLRRGPAADARRTGAGHAGFHPGDLDLHDEARPAGDGEAGRQVLTPTRAVPGSMRQVPSP